MDNAELLKKLKNMKKKWRSAYTKEGKRATALFKMGAASSAEKSVGVTIGYGWCLSDLEKLIKGL